MPEAEHLIWGNDARGIKDNSSRSPGSTAQQSAASVQEVCVQCVLINTQVLHAP